MEKKIWLQGLAAGVILLFLGLTVTPVLGAIDTPGFGSSQGHITDESGRDDGREKNRFRTVEVMEYRPDGSQGTRMVRLPVEAIQDLKQTFSDVDSVDEGFAVLKKWGLIGEGIEVEDWKEGMEAQAKKLGLSSFEMLSLLTLAMTKNRVRLPVMISFFNKVDAVYVMSTRSRIGFPPYRGILKFVTRFRFYDLLDLSSGLVGVVNARNILRQHSLVTMPSVLGLGGFVGMHIHIPFILNIFTGFSAVTFAAGFGLHTVSWLPWIPDMGPD